MECKDEPFHPEKMRKRYGDRAQPWHSVEEICLGGRWLVTDCTVDKEQGEGGRRKVPDFDGIHDLPTVEDPVLERRGSAPDMPASVGDRHRGTARIFFHYLEAEGALPVVPDEALQGDTAEVRFTPSGIAGSPPGWRGSSRG